MAPPVLTELQKAYIDYCVARAKFEILSGISMRVIDREVASYDELLEDITLDEWFAADDPRSQKIESTKRVRGGYPLADPPEGNFDWTREVKRRAELSRYGLPPFVTPLYGELRKIWREHRDPDVRPQARP